MAFLLAPLGLGALLGGGGGGDNGLSIPSLVSLICSALLLAMGGYGIFKSPIKTPPMLIAMLVCCCCSSSSTGTALKDIAGKMGMS